MEVEKPVSFSLLSRLLKKSHLRLDFRSGATDRKVPPCSLTHSQLQACGSVYADIFALGFVVVCLITLASLCFDFGSGRYMFRANFCELASVDLHLPSNKVHPLKQLYK
ncbi:hypothetical protein TNCV_196961 [Trichonephila clavipes]|uniref:Uncharacterized protein n=1 Tax=Trichonephila clavipes TaxID=2585209 RepID=A0A8X7BKS4_TRICX|nr:hypothetical protein TNCV_196961 [Trichonephila clavipes]